MGEMDFKEGEIVWHTAFKTKAVFCYETGKAKDRWFKVQLPNGGFMETQKIEKYKGQDQLPDGTMPKDGDDKKEFGKTIVKTELMLDDEEQFVLWADFLRALKTLKEKK